MMRQMRENTKWIMLITFLAFLALMVFEWGMDLSGRSSAEVGEIGAVNGTPVMYDQYDEIYRNLYEQYSSAQEQPITSRQNREIEDAAWDQIVERILLAEELERRGIVVTDEEVRQAALFSPPPEFQGDPAFQTEGAFDIQKYQSFISSLADEALLLQLEFYYRSLIPRSKLLRQVASGIYITEAELWQRWKDDDEQVRVRYLDLDPAGRIPDSAISVDAEEIESYYRENREEFTVPARASVKVVILGKAPAASDTAASLARVVELRKEILGGADFAEVAKRESADPGSAEEGGDLGTFGRGRLVRPLDEAAFAARVGRVSEPVKTSFGYHLLQVTKRAADSVTARHILVPIQRTDESEIALFALADSLEDLTETHQLEEAAEIMNLSVQTVEIRADFSYVAGAGGDRGGRRLGACRGDTRGSQPGIRRIKTPSTPWSSCGAIRRATAPWSKCPPPSGPNSCGGRRWIGRKPRVATS